MATQASWQSRAVGPCGPSGAGLHAPAPWGDRLPYRICRWPLDLMGFSRGRMTWREEREGGGRGGAKQAGLRPLDDVPRVRRWSVTGTVGGLQKRTPASHAALQARKSCGKPGAVQRCRRAARRPGPHLLALLEAGAGGQVLRQGLASHRQAVAVDQVVGVQVLEHGGGAAHLPQRRKGVGLRWRERMHTAVSCPLCPGSALPLSLFYP